MTAKEAQAAAETPVFQQPPPPAAPPTSAAQMVMLFGLANVEDSKDFSLPLNIYSSDISYTSCVCLTASEILNCAGICDLDYCALGLRPKRTLSLARFLHKRKQRQVHDPALLLLLFFFNVIMLKDTFDRK